MENNNEHGEPLTLVAAAVL